MSETTTTWLSMTEAATVYDAAMADIGVDHHPGHPNETTAQFLARSIRIGHLPGRLTTRTRALQVDAYALQLLIERAITNRPLPTGTIPAGYRRCGRKYGDRDTPGRNAQGLSYQARDGRKSHQVFLADGFSSARQLGVYVALMPLNAGVTAEDEYQSFLPIRRAENRAAQL